MAEQDLDHPDVDLLFQQVGGEAVAQGVHRNPLVDPGRPGGGVDGTIELPGAQGLDWVQPGEQPATVEHLALRPGNPPPEPQAFEEDRREHGVAVFASFALFDAQGHAFAVDVADFERRHFTGPQAGAIGEREGSLVLEIAASGDQSPDFLSAENTGSFCGTRRGCIRAITAARSRVMSKKNFRPVMAAFTEIGEMPASTR